MLMGASEGTVGAPKTMAFLRGSGISCSYGPPLVKLNCNRVRILSDLVRDFFRPYKYGNNQLKGEHK
jgi:hypothetical protein